VRGRAGVYAMPFDQMGDGQLYWAIVAQVLASEYDVNLIHQVEGLTHERFAQD